jgi:glycosyltransferase involved in cell wall biosynthesis
VDRPEQTWLVLSHAFNMDGRAASHTITDKIPYLRALGVRPIVLSAITGRRDAALEHHQLLPASPVGLRFDLRHALRQRVRSRWAYNATLGAMTLVLLPFYLVEKLFVRLETQWSWFLPAYLRGAKLIRARRPALIYSTGGANSAHWAGYLLARRFGLAWIAEVHDPMVVEGAGKSRMASRFARWLEGRICARADVAIWFTDAALARARARHPELGVRGHSLIPGADQPAFHRAPYARGDKLVIGHFGSLAPTRNLAIFLQALARVLDESPQLRDKVRVHLYGGGVDAISREAMRALPPGVVHAFGRLESDPVSGESGRERVLKRMNAADCLLLLHGTEDYCAEYIPSKLYEYLWTQRPILALVWHNPQMKKMLEDLGHWAVDAVDTPAIERALHELIGHWQRDALPDSGRPSPYSVQAAVRELVAWADAALAVRGG